MAVPDNDSSELISRQVVPIAILGADVVLAALPATPVQLAHACLRAGFSTVIPASWGDELIADTMAQRASLRGAAPVIQCSCPIVADRLLSVGPHLRPVLIPLVSPPVAAARYLRAFSEPGRMRITYIGACPGASDDAIDARMTPEAFLAMLAERGIVPEEQARVFESVIPPDRRRYRSQPGGLPTADALWTEHGGRSIIEIEGDDIPTEIAQHLLSGQTVLIDASARLGCSCAGAAGSVDPAGARARVVGLEPPRAATPVVDHQAPIELDLALPVAPLPLEYVATAPSPPAEPADVASSSEVEPRIRPSPTRGLGTIGETARVTRNPMPTMPARPVLGAVPVARGTEGRSLPRAYVARRRSSPKGLIAISAPIDAPREPGVGKSETAVIPPVVVEPVNPPAMAEPQVAPAPPPVVEERPAPQPRRDWPASAPPPTPSRRTAILVILLVLAVCASAAVGVIIGRSLDVRPRASAVTP